MSNRLLVLAVMSVSLGGCVLGSNADGTESSESVGEAASAVTLLGPYTWQTAQTRDRMEIDLEGPSAERGTKAHLWEFYLEGDGSKPDGQLWYLVPENGYYKFQSLYALARVLTPRCLDLVGPSSANGTQVHLWDCYETDSQLWKQVADGFDGIFGQRTYRFINKFATSQRGLNVCLDVAGWGTNNGAKIQIWECTSTNNKNQKWY